MINEESIDDYLDAQGEARHSDAATREDEIYARQNEKNSRYQAFWGGGNE